MQLSLFECSFKKKDQSPCGYLFSNGPSPWHYACVANHSFPHGSWYVNSGSSPPTVAPLRSGGNIVTRHAFTQDKAGANKNAPWSQRSRLPEIIHECISSRKQQSSGCFSLVMICLSTNRCIYELSGTKSRMLLNDIFNNTRKYDWHELRMWRFFFSLLFSNFRCFPATQT